MMFQGDSIMLDVEITQRVLEEGLRHGADLSEVYFEKRETLFLGLDDGKLENAIYGEDQGGGVRVFYGDTAAYAYTDDLAERALIQAAGAASEVAKTSNESRKVVEPNQKSSALDLSIEREFKGMSEVEKADLLQEMDRTARKVSAYITQVQASYHQLHRQVWIYNSDGLWVEDDRNILELGISVTAQRNGSLQRSSGGFGGQVGLELFNLEDPLALADEIARSAVKMLDAVPAPAGEMTVVLPNGWGGVLFHEACGHAMEADFVSKGTSAYAGLVGEQIASNLISAYDDGTIPGRRGSLRFDDDGTPSSPTVLIENGVLKEYMWDLTEARRVGRDSTGNGRRQSFRHMPMPRMTNTFIGAGPHDPEEIIASVESGLYVKRLGGGQADIARGDFVFSVTEGYLIEGGKITSPVRGATIMGNGPEVLKRIDMVGTDLALDRGRGMCGKGQSARVSVGQPTVRVPQLTVGGTDREIIGQMGA
jgi:TldD protein